jgi:putative beta-lysine N-acetyltransferase
MILAQKEPIDKLLDEAHQLSYHSSKETDTFKVLFFIDFVNNRLKIEDYTCENYDAFVGFLETTAQRYNLYKIIIVAKQKDWEALFVRDFLLEALHPSFFKGEPGFHLAKFTNIERQESKHRLIEKALLKKVQESPHTSRDLPSEYTIKTADPVSIPELSNLYTSVFSTYPSPMNDHTYLEKIMQKTSIFKIMLYQNKIISAASIDVDQRTSSAELTDCATIKDHSGKGLMSHLVKSLENEAKQLNLITLYSIARASSVGMNSVFSHNMYNYYGCLINNCHICGQLENMNIWSKRIN